MEDQDLTEPMESILLEALPKKSAANYKKAWKEFTDDQKIPDETSPTEADYLRYLSRLRKERSYKGSTLWSLYSKLNAVHQSLYSKLLNFVLEFSLEMRLFCLGHPLQKWPRIKKFIKTCESGETVKKASIFSYEDLVKFAKMRLNSKYWQVRKVIVALGYFGGLRNIELRDLRVENLHPCEEGIEVEFTRVKQRKNIKVRSTFLSMSFIVKDCYC